MQGNGIELGQDRNAIDPRVDAVADGNINQAVFSPDGHGGLGTHPRQRVKPRAAPAAHDHCQDFVCCRRHRRPPQRDKMIIAWISTNDESCWQRKPPDMSTGSDYPEAERSDTVSSFSPSETKHEIANGTLALEDKRASARTG